MYEFTKELFERVECIKGEEQVGLVEGAIYSIVHTTKKGNYLFFELDPPSPFNCFDKNRFRPVKTR